MFHIGVTLGSSCSSLIYSVDCMVMLLPSQQGEDAQDHCRYTNCCGPRCEANHETSRLPSPSLGFRLGLLNGNLHKLPYPGCDIRDLRIKFALVIFTYCGYRVVDGVSDHLRQGLVLADVACEQFVLANDTGG